MHPEIASDLVFTLRTHPAVIPVNRPYFYHILLDFVMDDSSRFHETLPANEQRVEDSGQLHYLTFRRVLRNGLARDYAYGFGKRMLDWGREQFGAYSPRHD